MEVKILILLLQLYYVYGQDEATVNQYVDEILQFHKDVEDYVVPVDSRSFLHGGSEDQVCSDGGSYDFIIVGAGSSGSVVASRLSEEKDWSILLLEAGDKEDNLTDIPIGDRNHWLSKYNWGYNSVPQKDVMQGYVNNSITIPRGKAIGGGSVINSLIYSRGNSRDFDKWASLGNPNWSYKTALKYFKKSERNSLNVSTMYHGNKGPHNVEYSRIFDEIGQAFLDANAQRGGKILDYNGKAQMGFSILEVNEINGVRDSVAKAFLTPIETQRKNLKILSKALVMKILLNNLTKTATGVKFIRNGKVVCVKAKKEVIVSGGPINTPQILMLSGIGPKKDLKKLNIPVIQDLPVGENLWDHLLLQFLYFSCNYSYPFVPDTPAGEREEIKQNIIEYLNGKGPFTSCGAESAIGYGSPYTKNKDVPDIEYVLHVGRDSPISYNKIFKTLRYTNETFEFVSKPPVNISAIKIHPILLHPKSRGTVKLKTASPFDFPLIDPQYFTHLDDVLTFMESVRYSFDLLNMAPFKKYNATNVEIIHPVCKDYVYNTDDFWLCMIRNLATTTHHYAGTCRMGPRSDKTTVVDQFLKVHGVGNLRVIDCSVIPNTLSGHTNAVAVMIGEHGADIIKQQYNL